MTRVNAIQSNERRRSYVFPMAEGMALGTAAGYATKYILPLTSEEKSTDEYIKVANEITSRKNKYCLGTARFLDNMKNKNQKTLAEDEFIKMFDGMKNGDELKQSNLRNAFKNLQDKPTDLKEFKKICREVSALADKTVQQYMSAHNFGTKHIRPTGFFLVTGAVVGAVMSAINQFFKIEIQNGI